MKTTGINVFSPIYVHKNEVKVNAVDHMNGKTFIVGDKKGVVSLYDYNPKKQASLILCQPIKVSKNIISKVVALSKDKLIAAVLTNGELHVVDFIRKSSALVTKGVISFTFYPGDTTPGHKSRLFTVSKRKGTAYELSLAAENINDVFNPVKEFNFPNTPDKAVWHKNSVSVAFEGREYSILDFKTGKLRRDIKDYVKVPDENPIIRVTDDDEILFLSKIGKDYIGHFLNSNGDVCSKTQLTIREVKGISEILATQKHIVIMRKNFMVDIYTKSDNEYLQTIRIPNNSKYFFMSNSQEELFFADRFNVYLMNLNSYESQI